MDNGRFGPIRTGDEQPKRYKINQSRLVTLLMAAAVVALGIYIVSDVRAKKSEPQFISQQSVPAGEYGVMLPGATEAPRTAASLRPQAEKEGLLPIFYQANTEEKRVAITVDGLGDIKNVNQILEAAGEYGAKLTFFPTGDEIMAHASLWPSAILGGHEIENHTNANSRLALLGEDAKAEEIALQTAKLRDVIGGEYSAHFLRTNNLEDDTDPVLHSILTENGYYGIARWAQMTPAAFDAIRPGQILCYMANDAGVQALTAAMRTLSENGYQMVTLNALFEYPENLVSEESGA